MQTKSKQQKILAAAAKAGDLPSLCWYIASFKAGKESTPRLINGAIPVVPVVLWPDAGHHLEQAELSRVLAELLASEIRWALQTTAELVPTLYPFSEFKSIPWQVWGE